MTTQLTLEQYAARADNPHGSGIRRRPSRKASRITIQERFEAFNRDHEDVYKLLVKLARQVKSRGFKTFGIKALFEQVRWFYHIERGDREFKLNNVFSSRFARLIEANEPDLAGFFRQRELRSQ